MSRLTIRFVVFLFLLLGASAADAQLPLYRHNFNAQPAGPLYVEPPILLDSFLSNSKWEVDGGPFAWTDDGKGGKALVIENAAQPRTLDLSFDIDPGYSYTISAMDWYHWSSFGGFDTWTLQINDIDVATGTIPVDELGVNSALSHTGQIELESPVSGLTGTVHVKIILSGGNNEWSKFAIDDPRMLGDRVPIANGGGGGITMSPPNSPAGTCINGIFDVSDLGGATYAIPLKVSPGINGVQPNLSLNYNSQGGNGILGMGWSLAGASSIMRVPKNVYLDGKTAGINGSVDDRFALDGNRLLLTGGAYGSSGSQYRTEQETFRTITAGNTQTTSPGSASFTVTDANGWTYQYGSSSNSLVVPSSGTVPISWLLDRVTDLNGNYMTYEYLQLGNGQVALNRINYQANSNAGLSPQGYVMFDYADRSDIQVSSAIGGAVWATKRLTAVTSYQQSGSVARIFSKYTFGYTTNTYSHLTTITEAGKDNIQAVNGTSLTYGTPSSFGLYPHTELTQSQPYHVFAPGDYNGDGKTDLIRFSTQNNNNNFSLLLSQGGSGAFSTSQTGTLQYNPNMSNNKNFLPVVNAIPFDYDGDGKDDFFYQQTNGNSVSGMQPTQKPWIYLSNGTSINPTLEIQPILSTTTYPTTVFSATYPLAGDFDGDGKAEILQIASTQNIGTASPVSWLIGKEYVTTGATHGSNSNSPALYQAQTPFRFYAYTNNALPFAADNGAKFFSIDYNGDGKTDILQVDQGTATVWEMNVTFNNNHPVIGSPAFVQVSATGYPTIWHEIYTGDFNGDRITDVLTYNTSGKWEIGYGRGNGQMNDIRDAPNPSMNKVNTGGAVNYRRPVFVADFNGDGKSDIYEASPGTDWGPTYSPRVYYAKAYHYPGNNGFEIQYPSISASVAGPVDNVYAYWFGDFDGNGAIDMLTRNLYYDVPQLASFHADETKHLLTQIVDGLGAFTRISYGGLATSSNYYTSGSATYTYPFIKRTIPTTIVSQTEIDNGIGSSGNFTNYSYVGLKYHALGKGILGFDQTARLDVATNITVKKDFALNTTYAFPYLQMVRGWQGGVQLSQSENSIGVHDYGAHRIFTYPTQSVETNYTTGTTKTTTGTYTTAGVSGAPSSMDIGKPMQIVTDKGNGLETVTQAFTYPSKTGPLYRYVKPARVTTTTARFQQPSSVRATSFTYSPSTGLPVVTVADPGLPKSVAKQFTYNVYGLETKQDVTPNGGATITTVTDYDASHRFPTRSYNPTFSLVASTTSYDPLSGIATSLVAADGYTVNNTYDVFGRSFSTSDNNGASTVVTYGVASSFGSLAPGSAAYGVQTVTNTSAPAYEFYDRLKRLVRTATPGYGPSGSAHSGSLIYEDVVYNALGQVTTKSKPYFSTGTAQAISYAYDALGRNTAVTSPEGTIASSYSLSGGEYSTTVTSPAGQQKTTVSDASGKTISITDAAGTLYYYYHGNGQVWKVTLAGAPVSTIGFDAYDRVVSRADPNYGGSGAFQYTYDGLGRVQTETMPSGSQYTYTYDGFGNPFSKVGPEGTYHYTYNYSAGANCGKQTQVSGPGGAIQTYNYGKGDQVLTKVMLLGTKQFTTTYTYNSKGQVAGMTYPNGKQIRYNYSVDNGDLRSILGTLTESNVTHYLCYDKNEFGQTTHTMQGSSPSSSHSPVVTTNYSYDSHNLLTEQNSTGLNSLQLARFGYNFNYTTGNLADRADLNRGLWEVFSYDNLNRLTQVQSGRNGPYTIYFPTLTTSYTPNGNISDKSDAGTFSYNQANRLGRIAPYVNIPSIQQDVTYTPFNRVASVKEDLDSVRFTYWPDGTRSSMAIYQNGQLQKTKYYVPGFEREEASSGNVRDLCYIKDGSGFIKGILENNNGTEEYYYPVTDHLGSLVQWVNRTGVVVAEKSYDAWGRGRNPNTWVYNSVTTTSDGWDRTYTGHELLPQFGIINMNGRLYDPLLGRMFSPDPYVMGDGNSQGYNRYSYAVNNPLTYTDPTGQFIWVPVIIGAALGAYMGGSIANSTYNPLEWDYSSGRTWGYMAGGALTGAISGGIGASIAAAGGFMSNTLAIMTSSFLNSVGTNIYTGGQTDISMSFGAASYNFTQGEFGYLGKGGNSLMENIGYGLGAFANISDAWSIYKGAFGSRAEDVNLRSDSHSIIETEDGNKLLDVGTLKQRSTITNREGVFGKLDITTDYRGYQRDMYGEHIKPSIFNRVQSVQNVRLDRLYQYKVALEQSCKTYGFMRIFGGSSINCTGGAAMGLLSAGVFNIPIAIPGVLSLQMYLRQFSYFSGYTINK